MSILYKGPSIDASYPVSYHLAKRLQRKSCFRNWPIRNKNCLHVWRPCLLTDQNGMRNSHRCFLPGFGSFDLTVSEEKNLKNRTIRSNNRIWRSWLLTDRDEMSKLYRGPSINAAYQVSVRLAKEFQRRWLKCEKLTDDGRRAPSDESKNHLNQ